MIIFIISVNRRLTCLMLVNNKIIFPLNRNVEIFLESWDSRRPRIRSDTKLSVGVAQNSGASFIKDIDWAAFGIKPLSLSRLLFLALVAFSTNSTRIVPRPALFPRLLVCLSFPSLAFSLSFLHPLSLSVESLHSCVWLLRRFWKERKNGRRTEDPLYHRRQNSTHTHTQTHSRIRTLLIPFCFPPYFRTISRDIYVFGKSSHENCEGK